MACGQFRFFFRAQGCGRRFPTPRPCYRRGPGNTIPSISPIRAQARGRFAQVIHMVVHSKAGKKFSCPAGGQQRASAPVLTLRNRHAHASTWPEPG